jgi:signal recognition particle receptor subunit beta
MVSINFSTREVNCKIVYYGPGLSGKTTNLQYVHTKVPKARRGDLISLATESDRTLYFDFLPIDIGSINGMATKFQLYTVPGQVFYNATRKLVLRGADGVVFVADSQRSKREENIESLHNLKENLLEYGYDMATMPVVLQYNKRDLPDLLTIEELDSDLNWSEWRHLEAAAVDGTGVFDTLKLITKLVLDRAKADGRDTGPIPVGATVGKSEETDVQMTSVASTPAPDEKALDRGESSDAEEAEVERVEIPGVPEQSESVTLRETSSPAPQTLVASESHGQAGPGTEPVAGGVSATAIAQSEGVAVAEVPAPERPVATQMSEDHDPESNEALSSAEFADSFEVPRVISMQKSLKIKKKNEKRFSLFGWLRRLFS